jgi:hypothetical protein
LESDNGNNDSDGIPEINAKGDFIPGFGQILKLRRFGNKGSGERIDFLVCLEGHGNHPEKRKYKNTNNNDFNTNIKEFKDVL